MDSVDTWNGQVSYLNKTSLFLPFAIIVIMAAPQVFGQDEDPGLKLSASATGTYSNNYLRLSDINAAARPSLVPQEYSLSTNALLGWNQRMGRQYVYVNADVGYRFNKNNSQLDTEAFMTSAGLKWQLGARCQGDATVSFDSFQSSFESLDDLIHNKINRKTAGLNAWCRVGARWGLSFGGDIKGASNSDGTRAINDLDQQQLWAGLRLNLRGDDYVNVRYKRTWRQYDNRFIAIGITDENRQTSIGLEIQKAFGPRITVDGWAGHTKLTNKALPSINFSGFTGRANITYKLGPRHLVTVGARREIDSSANLTASYSNMKNINFTLASRWGAKMHSEISLNQDVRDIALQPSIISGSTFNNSHDKTRMASASMGYDIGRLISVRLYGRIADRDALLDRFDYTEKAIMLSLRFKYN